MLTFKRCHEILRRSIMDGLISFSFTGETGMISQTFKDTVYVYRKYNNGGVDGIILEPREEWHPEQRSFRDALERLVAVRQSLIFVPRDTMK